MPTGQFGRQSEFKTCTVGDTTQKGLRAHPRSREFAGTLSTIRPRKGRLRRSYRRLERAQDQQKQVDRVDEAQQKTDLEQAGKSQPDV